MADGGVESLGIAGAVVFARKGFGGEGQTVHKVGIEREELHEQHVDR